MKLSETISNPSDAVAMLRKAVPRGKVKLQECMVVLTLDGQHRAIGNPILVAMGTVNSVHIAPRDIFREAIKRNAPSIIVGHNHPSGKLAPSNDDILVHRRLTQAGELLGIKVLDSIVFGKNDYQQFGQLDVLEE